MFCPKCGSEVKDGDMFCGECGMRMEPLESENQQTESQKTADQNETQKSRPVQPNQAPNKAPAKSGGLFKGLICQKIHLSMKKHLKRQWIRMRQRLYQHQLVVM